MNNYKTYLVAIFGAGVTFANLAGWLDDETTKTLMNFVTVSGLAALRHSISKV